MSEARTTISENEIRQVADQIKKLFNPEKVIVFGSYAEGEPSADSDVDLLIILDTTSSPRELAYNIRKSISPAFPVDIIVRTPAQIEERVLLGDQFIQNILDSGQVL